MATSKAEENEIKEMPDYLSNKDLIQAVTGKRQLSVHHEYEMTKEAGINDQPYPDSLDTHESEINPEDSASGIHARERSSYISHISSTSSTGSQKSIQKARAREVELASKLEALKMKNQLEEKRRQLKKQLVEEEAREEIEESTKRAQEIIRMTQAKAAQMRRRRELEEEEEKIKQLQIEIDIKAEYEAAKAVCGMIQEQDSVVSVRLSPSRSGSSNHGQAQGLKIDSSKTKYVGLSALQKDSPSSATLGSDTRWLNTERLNEEEIKIHSVSIESTSNAISGKEQTEDKASAIEPLHQQSQQVQFKTEHSSPVSVQSSDVNRKPQPQQMSHDNAQPSIVDMVHHQGELTKLLLEHNLKSRLPQRVIQPYDGDPLEYQVFISAFEYCIEQKSPSNKDRLYYLEQYTRGEANKLVRSCMSAEDGYTEARNLLKKKYGNKHKIAEAYLKKVREYPDIKNNDATSLHKFAMLLVECKNTMTGLGYLQELDNTVSMKLLVTKLPYGLRDRWRRNVDYMEEEKGQVVKYSDFVSFVEKQARVATNPAYGTIVTDSDTRKQSSTRRAGSSFATSVEEKSHKPKEYQKSSENSNKPSNIATQRPCSYCSDKNHSVGNCTKLGKMPIGDRLNYLRQLGVCFGCLKKATHFSKVCNKKLTCKSCKRHHPTVLHQPPRQPAESSSDKQPATKTEGTTNAMCGLTGAGVDSSPSIIPVIVHSRETGMSAETYAYIDNGSDATFCTDSLMHQLNIKGKKTKLEIQTITEEKVVDSHILHGLEISDINRTNIIALPKVYTQEKIPADTADVIRQRDISRWPYLQKVELNRQPQGDHVHVGILIGNNVPHATEPWDIINSQDGGPYACNTLLGWTVHGVNKAAASKPPGISVNRIQVSIEQQMEKLFNHDFTERIAEDLPEKSLNDKQFISDVNDSIKHVNGHYEIGLPLKDHDRKFPNNKQQAEVRAAHLQGRFAKNTTFHNDYKTVVNDMITKGYAEKVPEKEEIGDNGKVWYIPHHGVYHPRKNKLRVVFDCAANYKGSSLNKELLQGPDLTSTLVGVMLRFRQESIALTADIEAMFHQVQVPATDRNLLRFLWWPGGDIQKPLEEYRMGVHLFGATSSPSCASFALQRTAEEAGSQYDQQVTSTVLHNFYVDDCLKSVGTEKEAVKLAGDLRKICKEGGFNLTKWTSNSRAVLQSIPESDRSKEVAVLDLDTEILPSERVLGMLWYPESDQFGFQIAVKDRPPTRRGILSVVSSIYDPLGFICPATLPAKQLMQELCKLKMGWDEEVSITHSRKWQQWIADLPKLEHLKVDRCYKPPDFGKVKSTQLHHFADASQKGYGTVSYMRSENENGDVHCAMILAKARVAPVKQVTIPRLELTAATIAVRVDTMIQRELEIPIDSTVFWTDSMSVLRYINNESARFQTFVANRVAVIRDGSNTSQWRYIQTKDNPADDSSRGLSVDQLLSSERWLSGPAFLWKSEEDWPVYQKLKQDLPEDDVEVKQVKANAVIANEISETLDKLLNHYSSWYQLKKAVAWILRVRNLLINGVHNRKLAGTKQDQNKGKPSIQPLTVAELQESENAIFRYVQRKSFQEEARTLEKIQKTNQANPDPDSDKNKQDPMVKRSSNIYKLNPIMVDGIIRVGGRLARAALPEETKFPTILPKKSHITDLVMREVHEATGHGGRNHMLSYLRRKYWVISANAAARRIITRCVTCRKQKARVSQQQMADLPEDRLIPDEPPFTKVGVDFFGPFEIKRGRSLMKRYGVIFTCLTTRAIHLEKADSLDTDSCLNAIRRFIARRGQVVEIRSDNGTNFVGAEKVLRDEIKRWNQSKIHSSLMQKNIEWKFNPPAASHMGGVWERQIRTVRKVMASIVKEQTLTDESLSTFFCEVEAIVNSRPITTVHGEAGDLEALTPNHLLLLKGKPSLPPVIAEQTGPYARRRWKQVQYFAELFWKRWSREYLVQLQERHKWNTPKPNIQMGDIVIIVDGSRPRNSWQLGRVIETLPDKKGLVRQVRVQTKSTTLLRPVAKLCVLVEGEGDN